MNLVAGATCEITLLSSADLSSPIIDTCRLRVVHADKNLHFKGSFLMCRGECRLMPGQLFPSGPTTESSWCLQLPVDYRRLAGVVAQITPLVPLLLPQGHASPALDLPAEPSHQPSHDGAATAHDASPGSCGRPAVPSAGSGWSASSAAITCIRSTDGRRDGFLVRTRSPCPLRSLGWVPRGAAVPAADMHRGGKGP